MSFVGEEKNSEKIVIRSESKYEKQGLRDYMEDR